MNIYMGLTFLNQTRQLLRSNLKKGHRELSHVLISVLCASGSAEGTTKHGAIKQVWSASDIDATAEPRSVPLKPLGEE